MYPLTFKTSSMTQSIVNNSGKLKNIYPLFKLYTHLLLLFVYSLGVKGLNTLF
ncbi:hypothetical protein LDVICp123 [lymphocystis disease virus-China]|uniref:Uncharacterized protein n=1 Tax=lymphocystis disease virus-China TaxID=256729 RepID=Q677Y9_9VIRU|nr:hypothetical protein LDVICp123 [lymphocystis disease virus-China]AAU10968.1 hypothetical protein [lymphocystis disease virus-China]